MNNILRMERINMAKSTRSTELQNRRIPVYIGVTGHRLLRSEETDADDLRARVREVLDGFRKKYPHTEFCIMTALAEGADQLVTTTAVEMGMKYAAVLPMALDKYVGRTTESGPDFSPVAAALARELFEGEKYAAQRDFSYVIPTERTVRADGTVVSPDDPECADIQFREVARFISDQTFATIALWDGLCDDGAVAGSGATVRDALHGKCYSRYRTDGITIPETRPVYHIYTPRPGAPRLPYDYALRRLYPEPLLESGNKWFTVSAFDGRGEVLSNEERTAAVARLFGCSVPHVKLPPRAADFIATETKFVRQREFAIDEQLRRIDDYNDQLLKNASFVTRDRYGLGLRSNDDTSFNYENFFSDADRLAQLYQRRRNKKGVLIILLAGLSYLALNVYSDLNISSGLHWVFLLAYIALLAVCALLLRRIKRSGLHQRYVDYRTLAEGLRTQCYWQCAGISDKPDRAARACTQNYYLRKQKSSVDWIRFALRSLNLHISHMSAPNEVTLEEISGICTQWLGTMDKRIDATARWQADGRTGQSGYYEKKARKTGRKSAVLNGICVALVAVSIVLVLLMLANELLPGGLGFNMDWSMFVSGALPVLAMIISEINGYYGYDSDAARAAWYHMVFRRSVIEVDEITRSTVLSDSEKVGAIRKILFDIGKESLQENAEWVELNAARVPHIPSN